MTTIEKCLLIICLTTCNSIASSAQKNPEPIFKNSEYSLFKDAVVQGKFVAKAISHTELHSSYKSPVNEFKHADIIFKFSINGKDNEMKSGVDHHYTLLSQDEQSPLIKFGTQLKKQPVNGKNFLKPNTKFKIRLDMRDVLSAFERDGFYTNFNGEKIYKNDFKAVYVAGNTAPLTWDFDNLKNFSHLELKDQDGDGIYENTILLNSETQKNETASQWKLSKDISAFPQYSSDYPITNALYNLSIEEMINAVEADSTFRTGKEWAGVWTRDISYSIILSMAHLQPAVAKYSLLKKVSKKKKIIQDTGTGGAWPISTDRMVWGIAAWELFKVTGDMEWLKEAYTIISNSIEDDYHNVYDHTTGMVKGESSFLDWREQTYPRWMQPADIFESENLGTNAVHFEVNVVLSKMASLLNKKEDAKRFLSVAEKIKTGINKYLWLPGKGYYAQYVYGRINKIVSPNSEALGEALTVLFDIADKARQVQIVKNVPQTNFGIPCIYPQIPGIPPYHNNAVWPFVQSYWLWAAAKTANENAVMESMAAIYRPAALFLTNKENFVADNGDFLGTEINSSNMLWSLSGNISIVHKVLFGIKFNIDNISFNPFVPKAFNGKRKLTNFRYRDAVLDIEMEGFGNKISTFYIDGKEILTPMIPADMKGKHLIRIRLAKNILPADRINVVENYFSPASPETSLKGNEINWASIPNAYKYDVYKNGIFWKSVNDIKLSIDTSLASEYAVKATDKKGISSFASEPIRIIPARNLYILEAEAFGGKAAFNYMGASGNAFAEISTSVNTSLKIPLNISSDGVYIIDCRYSNGNGPVNTENKCAIRTARIDDKKIGVFVLPQRGSGEWSDWGFTNCISVFLTKGKHELVLDYLPANENMNLEINQAMIDYVRISR